MMLWCPVVIVHQLSLQLKLEGYDGGEIHWFISLTHHKLDCL